LIPCLILLPHATFPVYYYLLAAAYGLCLGVILPLLNALLFSASPPSLRGLNTNMTLFAMDAAYFVMPYLGGILITSGAGFDALFYIAAGFVMLSMALIMILSHGLRHVPTAGGTMDEQQDTSRHECFLSRKRRS
jgi:MFS family permease